MNVYSIVAPVKGIDIGMAHKWAVSGLFAIFVLQSMSCEYHVENEDLQGELCNPAVSYSVEIAPLIANNCMPCHNGDGTFPQAPDLRTYASVERISGLVKTVTQTRRMPKDGTITDEQIAAIGCWVDNGAPNN